MIRPFCFVEAADFCLEQPLYGLAEVPDHLAEIMVEAPYQAAARVFDAAVAENADFLLLNGDLIEPDRAGPRGPAFLGEQFARLAERDIAVYWAAGADFDRGAWLASQWPADVHIFPSAAAPRRMANHAGSPQGRSPDENGPHGCTVVHVSEQAQIRLVPLATDLVRWHHERIVAPADVERAELERLLHERLEALVAAAPDRTLFVRWTIASDTPLARRSRQTALAAELLSALRFEYGFRSPAAWTVAVEFEPTGELPQDWYEQQTLLGDYLRAVQSHELPGPLLELACYLSERQRAGIWADRLSLVDPATRNSVLRQAALWARSTAPAGRDRREGSLTMQITDITVDGFGVWSGLELHGLSRGLNVFYGPNEAGKTTLMQFVRAVLYGFSPERQARYLPPVHGGRGGGSVALATSDGEFRVGRFAHPDLPLGNPTVTAPDGTTQGEPHLKELLGDVDEAIFNNVFAVGLSEMQELATLDGTAASRLLYDLAAGLDRVSLADVMRELASSRSRLLDSSDRPSQITDSLARREKLRGEITELGGLGRRHGQLAAQRDRLAQEAAAAQAELSQIEHESRLAELAAALEPKWIARGALDAQIAALPPLGALPADAAERMDRVATRIRKCRRRLARSGRQRSELRAEVAGLKVNEPLWRQTPRIVALAEHESWIAAVEQQSRDAQTAVEQLEARRTASRQRLGLPVDPATDATADLSRRALASLRRPAKDLGTAGRAAREAREQIAQFHTDVETQRRAVEQALAARGEHELSPALEKAGKLVAQLRRRVQIDERLDRTSRHRADLEEQTHELLERQILPVWILGSIGGVFVLGVLLLLAGLFLPATIIGSLGWPLALVGLVAFGTAAATKWMLERAAARQLDSCRKQLAMLETQATDTQKERDALDAELPSGGGALTARLQAAEATLAALEELMPLDAKRQAAEHEALAAETRAAQARDELRAAHRRWRAALAGARLPHGLSPKQLRQLAKHRIELSEIERRLSEARDERDRRGRELAAFTARIEPLFIDAELLPDSSSPSEQLRQLRREAAEQEPHVARRDAIQRRLAKIRRARHRFAAELRRSRRRRLALLHWAQVANEAEFTRRAAEHHQLADLIRRRDALAAEIAAACAGVCSTTDLAAILDGSQYQHFGERREQLQIRLQSARAALGKLHERRGELSEQLRALADDRTCGRKQLELGIVEAKLAEATSRWQVLAATERILETIKHDYERDRQPEALREASEYLVRLTGGRYRRVWTPLGEDVLRVDDAAGQSLGVEVLSRGTREQLFLSLRLALVALYARRGAVMPLVLDDVLVNFDADRARLAAAVLAEFAAAGHQLLVFTCHEHLAAVFCAQGARVRRLPSNVDLSEFPEPPAPLVELADPPRPRRRSRAARAAAESPVMAEVIVVAEERLASPLPPPPPLTPVEIASINVMPHAPPAVRQRRADPPHSYIVASRIRRGWTAEEFPGELEDRIAERIAAAALQTADDSSEQRRL